MAIINLSRSNKKNIGGFGFLRDFCFLPLALCIVFPVGSAFSDDKKPEAPPADKQLSVCVDKRTVKFVAVNKNAYPNTASVIKDARTRTEAGLYAEALALYNYADEVVDIEKEPILKRKILLEREHVHNVIDQNCRRRLQELEERQGQKIKELYETAVADFNVNKFDEAEKGFKEILALDMDRQDAQNYIDNLIPRRVAEIKLKAEEIKLRAEAEQVRLRAEAEQLRLRREEDKEKRKAHRLALSGDRKWEQKQVDKPVAVDPNQPRVMVREIQFSNNSDINNNLLKEIVAADLGKELTLAELRLLADRVQEFYHDKGYFLAQVIIPQQDITDQKGVVNFTIFEGMLGESIITGNKRINEKLIRRVLSDVQPGEPILKQDLERALLVLNSYSGVTTSSIFQAGKETGTTNLITDVVEQNRIGGSLTIDNSGSSNTGRYRISPELNFRNLSGRGDLLNIKYVRALDAKDMYLGHFNYMTPVGSNGVQLKTYASKGSFPVGEEFAGLGIKSSTTSWGLGVYYPYFLSQTTSVSSELWFEASDLEQTMLSVKTIDDHIRKLRFDFFSYDKRDNKGRTLLTLGFNAGLGDNFGGMSDHADLSSRGFAKADNRFYKITFGAARSQIITDSFILVGRLSGQYSFDPLVAGEQWSIGGFNSVHGHQSSAYLGDDGLTANLEGRLTVASTGGSLYQFVFFGDHGMAHIKKPFVNQKADPRISGVGLGVFADIGKMFEVRLDWGVPVGSKTGNDNVFYFETKYKF